MDMAGFDVITALCDGLNRHALPNRLSVEKDSLLSVKDFTQCITESGRGNCVG